RGRRRDSPGMGPARRISLRPLRLQAIRLGAGHALLDHGSEVAHAAGGGDLPLLRRSSKSPIAEESTMIRYFAVAALSVMLASPVPSQAAENGLSRNGVALQNGITLNGITRNGLSRNGITRNGITRNGITRNGITRNGGDLNAKIGSETIRSADL